MCTSPSTDLKLGCPGGPRSYPRRGSRSGPARDTQSRASAFDGASGTAAVRSMSAPAGCRGDGAPGPNSTTPEPRPRAASCPRAAGSQGASRTRHCPDVASSPRVDGDASRDTESGTSECVRRHHGSTRCRGEDRHATAPPSADVDVLHRSWRQRHAHQGAEAAEQEADQSRHEWEGEGVEEGDVAAAADSAAASDSARSRSASTSVRRRKRNAHQTAAVNSPSTDSKPTMPTSISRPRYWLSKMRYLGRKVRNPRPTWAHGR